ncbi:zinc transporter ZIP1-like [Haliotis asinina]|uniref:zinc transporter ZIP1-like n=1 Tax=Haliotis asinina TaxID=109174 RepID=UPI00353218A5
MDTTAAKIIAIVILLVLTLVLGIIPYFIIKKKLDTNTSSRRERILNLLNCFAGGVFLGTCLLHLMVEGNEDLEEGLSNAYNFTGFPVFQTLTGVGFFIIAGVEQLAMLCMTGLAVTSLSWNREKQEPYNEMNRTRTSISSESRVSEQERSVVHIHDLDSLSSASGLGAFLVLIALSFHTIFDGLAVGLQQDSTEVWEVFVAISIHKSLVAFCLGLQLFKAFMQNFKKPFACLCFFSLMSPIGICIGIAVTSSDLDLDAQAIASGILQGIACGTFLYVTCFEILREAFASGKSVLNVFVALVGFLAMAGVKALDRD